VNPTRQDVDALAEHILNVAKSNLKKHGRLAPIAVLLLPTKRYTIHELDFSSDPQKHRDLDKFIAKLHKYRASGAMLLSEAWVSMLEPDETEQSLKAPVSTRANRTEAICLAVKTWTMSFTIYVPFNRAENGEPIFAEQIINNTKLYLFGDSFELSARTDVHGHA